MMTTRLVLLLLAATTCEGRQLRLPPAREAGEPLAPLLRCRGGERGGSLHHACQKLCSKPGLVASAGGTSSKLRSLAQRHVRGVVFGGMDGILTTFALLAAVEGSAAASTTLTLVIGVSTVLADALSMAAGEYLSAKAEAELQGGADADEPGPLEKGFAMFLAFTLFGSLPLAGAVFSTMLSRATGSSASFQISISITAATLFALGAIKSQFGAGVWWQAGVEVAGIGGVAATVAYYTARVVESLMGA